MTSKRVVRKTNHKSFKFEGGKLSATPTSIIIISAEPSRVTNGTNVLWQFAAVIAACLGEVVTVTECNNDTQLDYQHLEDGYTHTQAGHESWRSHNIIPISKSDTPYLVFVRGHYDKSTQCIRT